MLSDSPDFSRRAVLSEWMDEPCSYADFKACLRDLAQVNRWTFAYRPTLAWLRQFAGADRPLHIVDVGCGGGDVLRRIERWAQASATTVQLTGIDLNPYAAQAARSFTSASSRICWLTGDAFSTALPAPPDLILSSLFTHHLPEDEIVRFLQWMEREAALGWLINDLERAAAPYYLFRALAGAARWHRFVRHDGPVSVRRAFSVQDWARMIGAAGLDPETVSIEKWRPSRLCVSRVRHVG